MKSPREILLHRHRAAEPKLEALRAKAVAELTPAASSRESRRLSASWPSRVAWVLWRELIFPCRHIWAGLAAAWLVLLVLNLPVGGSKPEFQAKATPPDREVLALLQEQREMLVQLIQTSPPSPTVPRKTPAPHSQRLQTITLV